MSELLSGVLSFTVRAIIFAWMSRRPFRTRSGFPAGLPAAAHSSRCRGAEIPDAGCSARTGRSRTAPPLPLSAPQVAPGVFTPPAARSRRRSRRPSRHRSFRCSQVLAREVCLDARGPLLARRLEAAKARRQRRRGRRRRGSATARRHPRSPSPRPAPCRASSDGRRRRAAPRCARSSARSGSRSTIAHLCTSGQAASTCSTWRWKPANAARSSSRRPSPTRIRGRTPARAGW